MQEGDLVAGRKGSDNGEELAEAKFGKVDKTGWRKTGVVVWAHLSVVGGSDGGKRGHAGSTPADDAQMFQ